MGIVSAKLRASAKGQECTFRIPGVCNHDIETTVLAHIHNEAKGTGNKADDWSAAFACSACHDALDQRRLGASEWAFFSLDAMQRTHRIWYDMGLIKIAGDDEKPRKPSKKSVKFKSLYRRGELLPVGESKGD